MPVDERAAREIEHGEFLAAEGPEAVWGWGTPAGQLRAKRRAELIGRAAGLAPGQRVLEIGCGTGNFTEKFAASGAHIVAVDISPALIQLAERRHVPGIVTWLCTRFEDAELLGPFNAVIGSSVLHHLDSGGSLTRILELLKPGGRLSFAEPNMLNPQILVQKNVPWVKRKLGDSPDETAFVRYTLARLLACAGFEEIRIQPFDWLHPATPRVIIPAVRSAGHMLERIPGVREFAGSLLITASRP